MTNYEVSKGNSTIETSQIINCFFLWHGVNTWIETVRLKAYTDGLSPQVSTLPFQFMSNLQALLWKTLYALCGASALPGIHPQEILFGICVDSADAPQRVFQGKACKYSGVNCNGNVETCESVYIRLSTFLLS